MTILIVTLCLWAVFGAIIAGAMANDGCLDKLYAESNTLQRVFLSFLFGPIAWVIAGIVFTYMLLGSKSKK